MLLDEVPTTILSERSEPKDGGWKSSYAKASEDKKGENMEEIKNARELLAKAQEQLSASDDTVERIRRIKVELEDVRSRKPAYRYLLQHPFEDNSALTFAIKIIEAALGDDPSPQIRNPKVEGPPEDIKFDLGLRQSQTKGNK